MKKSWDGCWIGIITDRLNSDKIVYKSKPTTTWEEAHKRASHNPKSKLPRYAICVVDCDYFS